MLGVEIVVLTVATEYLEGDGAGEDEKNDRRGFGLSASLSTIVQSMFNLWVK